VFMDSKYSSMGLPFKQALTLLATVISTPAPGRAIIDAGIKVLTTENGLPTVVAPKGVKLIRLNEEHGTLEVGSQARLKVGDRVEIIPSHICTTVNLHERYYVMQGKRLVETWPISGRGKSQ
jgi:D-threonine aldolase